jgi:outer membrane protein assembly factor BamB
VRVPGRVGSPERILVLSADTETLTAVDTDGNQLWAYRLSKLCLGRPVVVGQFAYLPTYDGWVHEIELAEGRLVGRYRLGQALTMGGAREGRTSRVYFPADDNCVYVLDVAQRRCVGVLYSGHPADSLRSEPLVIAPDNEAAPRFLVLNQKQGLGDMVLKVFELREVLENRNAAPLALGPQLRLAGWTWSRPYLDDEKVAMLTDQGVLGLFGIRQANNHQDPALFPLLQPGGLKLDKFLPPEAAGRARAQVVHVQGDDVWVLAYGQMQRLQLAWSATEGLKPVAVWSRPRELGSPLHASQVLEDRQTGRSTLVVVTQPLAQQTCLATAVDDETGTVLWQRQLGLVCQGEPLELAPADGGPPLLLALDQGGGLYVLDPQRFPAGLGAGWQSGGQGVLLARPLDANPAAPPVLALAPDGRSAYEIAAPGHGRQLVVRHVQWGVGRQLGVTERKVPLSSPLMGTPAVVGAMLVLPLADGALGRLRLPLPAEGAEPPEGGPDWRSRRAPPGARGTVVALGPDLFLTTDGARGVTLWQWPPGAGGWKSLPAGRDPPTLELNDRVVGAPLVLPAAAGARPRVCVADANGQVTLLVPTPDGGLAAQRTWEAGPPMTTGPFLCRLAGGAVRVGCLAGKDNSQLAWLDPDRAGLRWRYATPGGEPIVGLPRRADNLLIVADGSGRFVGLDVETGKAEGPGYALRGSVAPAVAPVPFGPGRLFASLSDGTALLLPLNYFRHPLRGVRPGW